MKLNPGTPSGEGVLANFFNSLLHKKSGSPGTPGGPQSLPGGNNLSPRPSMNGSESLLLTTPDKAAMRTDAAAELDRLTKDLVNKDMDFSGEC